MKFNRYKKLKSFENTLVLIFILVLTTLIFGYYKKYEDVVKSRVAHEQLYQINTSILLYTVVKNKFPDNLNVLISEEFLITGGSHIIKKKYIEGLYVDREGYPIDPWGRRYRYDKNRGLASLDESSPKR